MKEMAKLYSLEDHEVEESVPEEKTIETDISDGEEVLDEYSTDISDTVDGTRVSMEELGRLDKIVNTLKNKKIGSESYMAAMESYTIYISKVADDLGVKVALPSLEDYHTPYGARACHTLALEGMWDVVKKFWAKIVEFFKRFFAKIKLFLKRLVGANLKLEEYEAYIKQVIVKARRNEKSPSAKKVRSKLHGLVNIPQGSNSDYVINKTKNTFGNLLKVADKVVKQDLKNAVNTLKEIKPNTDFSDERRVQALLKNTGVAIDNIFIYNINYDEINEACKSNIDSVDAYKTNLTYRAMVDAEDFSSLPGKFNAYLQSWIDTDKGTEGIKVVGGYRKSETLLELDTITDVNKLEDLFDFYKTFSDRIDLDEYSKKSEDYSKIVNTAIENMKKICTNESIKAISTEAVWVNGVPMQPRDDLEEDSPSTMELSFTPPNNDVEKAESEINKTTEDAKANLNEANPGENPTTSPAPNITEGNPKTLTEERKKELIQYYNHLQTAFFNINSAIQQLFKIIFVDLVELHTRCKYELIKYIYLSAREFA